MREGSKESQVLIGNIHVHKDNTYGVSMMSDRTIDNKSDEASARSRGISIYAADSKGMTKVNASGKKSEIEDSDLKQDALNDYINTQRK